MSLFAKNADGSLKYLSVVTKPAGDTPRNPYATGYGAKIPSGTLALVSGKWQRVYVACYSNSGSPWVQVKGERVLIDEREPETGAELAMVDPRYTVQLEFCGEQEARYVARFCGDWLGKAEVKACAWQLAYEAMYLRKARDNGLGFFPFDGGRWHAWPSNGAVQLSDEDNKELRQFASLDDTVNWLYTNGHKEAARALNTHAKGAK